MKTFRNFLKIFWTSPECILGILESSQPSKIGIFSKFSFLSFFIHRIGHFGLVFRPTNFKTLAENWRGVVKKWKNLLISQKYSKLPQNTFWASWNHHNLQKSEFSQNLVFRDSSTHQICHFGQIFRPTNFKTLTENCRGVVKKWKKFTNFSKIF